jgi:hypothetical protein
MAKVIRSSPSPNQTRGRLASAKFVVSDDIVLAVRFLSVGKKLTA